MITIARKTKGRGKKELTDFSYLLVKENSDELAEKSMNDNDKEKEK